MTTKPHETVTDKCQSCDKPAQIWMISYADNLSTIAVCKFHALQLSRKLLEDLCELEGDRHG